MKGVQQVTTITQTRPASIVVLSADPSDGQLLTQELGAEGHQVSSYETDSALLEFTNTNEPDLVILDTAVGEGCWNALGELQTDPEMAACPTLVIAEEGDAPTISMSLELGAYDLLSRPLHPQVVRARVSAALQSRWAHQELARRRQQPEGTPGVDMLTGMRDQAMMRDLLELVCASGRRYDTQQSVVLLNLDRFAKVNERHGPAAGDEVLRSVARHIAADLRSSDIAGRWGGDAFMLVLPHTDVNGARVLAERLRLTFSEIAMAADGETSVSVTASFGVAQGSSAPELIETCEALVAESKRHGRNMVSSPSSRL